MQFNRLLARGLQYFLDAHQPCVLCGNSDATHGWCGQCLSLLVRHEGDQCRCCGEILPAFTPFCGACLRQKPAFDVLSAGLRFDYPLAQLIHVWKYQPCYGLTGAMRALAEQFTPENKGYDLVLPVPLAKERYACRGFNQSELLAYTVAKQIKVKLSARICLRIRNTQSQARLDLVGRRKNIKNAFDVKGDIKGANILIVDDVATSGATISALAKTLKKSGAECVDAWVLARSVLHNK